MRSKHTRYVSSMAEYNKLAERLDFVPCPHCRVTGCLNQHGKRRRYDERTGEESICAARIFCNNRGNMRGCGKTYPVVLIEWMSQYIVSCATLWTFLLALLERPTIKEAWESATSAFCLDTGYKLRKAFIKSQSHVRTLLGKLGPPARLNNITDTVLQTVEHLRSAFPAASCPISAFQIRFQRAFLG